MGRYMRSAKSDLDQVRYSAGPFTFALFRIILNKVSMPIRTLLADDADLALAGLQAILGEEPRVQVVGVVRDAAALFDALRAHRPDVVLIDHTAAGFGAEAIRMGRRIAKRTRFTAITHEPGTVALVHAMRGGVTGYVRKDCGRDEIISAVLETADGRNFFCGKVVQAMQAAALDHKVLADGGLTCDPVLLSERELEVLALIADGLSYTRIADRLGLSAHTVTTHRRNIMQKIGVNNTAALVMYAVKQGLTTPNKYLFNPG